MALTPQQAQEPTTATTEAETVAIVKQKYGSTVASKFQAWYNAAWKQDPSLTPDAATVTFLTGYGISSKLAPTTSLLTGSPTDVSSGNVPLGSYSSTGLPQAVAQGAQDVAVNSPLAGLTEIGDFFGALGELNTWIRVAKVVIGGVLLISGIVHLTGIDKEALGFAKNFVLPSGKGGGGGMPLPIIPIE
jgi:hypothetical protein